MISLSPCSVNNKTDMSNTRLWSSSASRYISLPSIDTPTYGNIYLSFQSLVQPLVDLFLICLMPKSWSSKLPFPITSSNESQDIDKYQLDISGISSCRIMFQHIESWLISFTIFKLRPTKIKLSLNSPTYFPTLDSYLPYGNFGCIGNSP